MFTLQTTPARTDQNQILCLITVTVMSLMRGKSRRVGITSGMIHETLTTSPVLARGQIKHSKVGFLKEKTAFVVCLSHGTGVCNVSNPCFCRICASLVAAAWVVGCVWN